MTVPGLVLVPIPLPVPGLVLAEVVLAKQEPVVVAKPTEKASVAGEPNELEMVANTRRENVRELLMQRRLELFMQRRIDEDECGEVATCRCILM